ncbi:MAG: hypothetical protein AAF481_12950 [Acidobacteriota bacterium]
MNRRRILILLLMALLMGATLHADRSSGGREALGQPAQGSLAWVQEVFDWLTTRRARQDVGRAPQGEPGLRRHDQGSPVPDADGCGDPSTSGAEGDCGPYLDPDG